ncbi:sigma-54 interaction domain-containing protein [Caballeronia mineralivorans]|uniref:sigma-54 interaction domain-containing protein n=1 Tax=Caballeronia mineralivorans TaxID=2010198 RepID=UPI002E13C395
MADDLMLLRILATLTGQLLDLHAGLRQKTWALERENAMLERAIETDIARYGIVGTSPAVLHAMSQLERVSDTSASVLLLGESGTGKELFARALHLASPRRDKPFIKLNCAAIPESLFEAELFGHERGAFTSATGRRAGWFEQADTGTLFLDEIGELPRNMQTKLLRALQEGTISRLGGKQEIQVDVRLVAATNRDLKLDVKNGLFRQDLYYRINVIPIRLPSLAERREDIPVLALHFLNQTNQAHQRNVNLGADAIRRLQQQPWPGNIRELENVIKRIVLLADEPIVDSDDIGRFLPAEESPTASEAEGHSDPSALAALAAACATGAVRPYSDARSHSPGELRQAVAQSGGNKSRAAQLLGLTTRQFAYRWEKYELDSTDEAPAAALPPSS